MEYILFGDEMAEDDRTIGNHVSTPSSSSSSSASASASTSSGATMLLAATSTVDPPQAGPSQPAARRDVRRSCEACRIRRVKCIRLPGLEACVKCLDLGIHCITAAVKARSSHKNSRIAQAKLLYGATAKTSSTDEDASDSVGIGVGNVIRSQQGDGNGSGDLSTFSANSTLVRSLDEASILGQIISSYSRLRLSKFPLLRWLDIEQQFNASGGRLDEMAPLDQALFMTVAAVVARGASPQTFDGLQAPTLLEISASKELRRGSGLCEYGVRREQFANGMLQAAKRKIREAALFEDPKTSSLKSVASFQMVEMLVLVYADSVEYSRLAADEARGYSSASALHLRMVGEQTARSPEPRGFSFYSVAWTAIIRDALIATKTCRPCDFTSDDLYLILNIDEDAADEVALPTAEEIVESWTQGIGPEGKLMYIWAAIILAARALVRKVAQPTALSRPRLPIDFIYGLYSKLDECRNILNSTYELGQRTTQMVLPEQIGVASYCCDWLVASAHRFITWRLQQSQLKRAASAGARPEEYEAKLQLLRIRSETEVYQAARRVVTMFRSVLGNRPSDSAEFFLPGYFMFENILVWASLIADTKYYEEGGRQDYPLAAKLEDLRTIREAMSLIGWSTATILPHIQSISRIIEDLEGQQSFMRQPETSSMDIATFENMSSLGLESVVPTLNFSYAAAHAFENIIPNAGTETLVAELYDGARRTQGDPMLAAGDVLADKTDFLEVGKVDFSSDWINSFLREHEINFT